MSEQRQTNAEGTVAPPGWYSADGDPANTMRYWDGSLWLGEPQVVQSQPTPPTAASASQFAARQVQTAEQLERMARQQAIRNEQVRRTGTRLGEGIPFHELYMRTRSRKGAWRS